MTAEIAADQEGKSKLCALRLSPITARSTLPHNPLNFPRDCSAFAPVPMIFPTPFCEVDGVYTNKAPGGIAYRCSFRVTEAAYLIERAMDVLRRS